MSLRLAATCAVGLEELLADEISALGGNPTIDRGAVRLSGTWKDVWRANYRLRTANRVLVELASWPATNDDELTRGALELAVDRGPSWDGVGTDRLFAPSATLAIRATSSRSRITDTRWIALKVKDGLVDGQRARFGRRSSIDRERPDLPLRVRLHEDRATLLLDTSREPLDRRGYREASADAPVREQLAAACILASGWGGRGPVVDPMCGSGTLLIEAGWIAAGRAPGCLRRRWAFEGLPGFDAAAWRQIRSEPLPAPDGRSPLVGLDTSPIAVAAARRNLTRAGLEARAQIERRDAFEASPPAGPGLLAVNPAYGERLQETRDQWRRLGDLLKQRYSGWTAVVLAGDPSRGKHIGLKPRRRWPVRNGPLDARILVFDLY